MQISLELFGVGNTITVKRKNHYSVKDLEKIYDSEECLDIWMHQAEAEGYKAVMKILRNKRKAEKILNGKVKS